MAGERLPSGRGGRAPKLLALVGALCVALPRMTVVNGQGFLPAILRGGWIGDVHVGAGYTSLDRAGSIACVPDNADVVLPQQVIDFRSTGFFLSGAPTYTFRRSGVGFSTRKKIASTNTVISYSNNILTWAPRPGFPGLEHAYLEMDPFTGALIWVQLRGEVVEAGLDPEDPTSYSDVMRNRAYCEGRLGSGMVYTEFGYFTRPEVSETPEILRGTWTPAVSTVASGDTSNSGGSGDECFPNSRTAKTTAGSNVATLSIESNFLVVSSNFFSSSFSGTTYRTDLPFATERMRFISYETTTGLVVAVNSATDAIHCFVMDMNHQSPIMYTAHVSAGPGGGLETDGVVPSPSEFSPQAEFPSFSAPCDPNQYSSAKVSNAFCQLRELDSPTNLAADAVAEIGPNGGTFSFAIHRHELARAGAPVAVASAVSLALAISTATLLSYHYL